MSSIQGNGAFGGGALPYGASLNDRGALRLIFWLRKSMVFFMVGGQKGDHTTCVFSTFCLFVGSVNRWFSIRFGVKKVTTQLEFCRLVANF